MIKEINSEVVNDFLIGSDPMERIVNIECGYMDDHVNIIFINDKGEKRIRKDEFKPFVWVKNSAAIRMYNSDRDLLKRKLKEYGISIKALTTKTENSKEADRLENGYKYLFYANRAMTYNKFLQFFMYGGTPIYEKRKKNPTNEKGISNREFLAVTPTEQYMMCTGKRLFKGYESYDELNRLQFDLETQGLHAEYHAIDQIGIRNNRGYEKILTVIGRTKEERAASELSVIEEFIKILSELKPDVIAGHNSENFDWNFIIIRLKVLGTSLEDLSLKYFKCPIHKRTKETVLKLGGEVEYFFPTIMWGFTIVDSLHAVRRAQAIDSNMKMANLKYVTKYLDLQKRNRVYVPGNIIGSTWLDEEDNYALNEDNGDWYKVTEKRTVLDGYRATSGRYIVERYLLDDLYETDKVELKLNESNFLLGKLLPTTFQRVCTMGAAASWKLLILTWCYENDLAVPAFGKAQRFVGGLSRLLNVGYVDNVVKLDYNSLYPSIILTWGITSAMDITNVMLNMLEYILTQREKFKGLMKKAIKEVKRVSALIKDFKGSDEELEILVKEKEMWLSEVSSNDKKQLPMKIFGNSFFGGLGSPDLFPYGDTVCAEKTTCIGRMSLRLMISHFTALNYNPIVGDSFTSDTPFFIKYNDSELIDIKPIGELINCKEIKIDALNREYDYSKKNYKVLCRSGWVEPEYIYRHGTDKNIHRVVDGESIIDVTEDHSLFNSDEVKIKPNEINKDTQLEYYIKVINNNRKFTNSEKKIIKMAKLVSKKLVNRIPIIILNARIEDIVLFYNTFIQTNKEEINIDNFSKTLMAQLLFLKNQIEWQGK